MVFALAFTVLLGVSDAHAGPALEVVRTNQTKLFKLIAQPKTPAREKKIKGMFDKFLNYKRLAKDSLGKKWGDLTDAQKAEFSDLLEKLVRNAYHRNLKAVIGFKMIYAGEQKAGKNKTLVKTNAKSKDPRDEPIELNFKMLKSGGKWLVIDIYTEGASLVKTYRSQFTRILRKKGFDALTAKMRKKLKKK
jgi:phospholipid transport system substrate-binding protein